MNTKNILSTIIVSVLATATGIVVAENWVGPTGTAPNNNVSAPLNTSTADQTKDGSIGVKNVLVGTDIILKGNASGSSMVGIGTTSPTAKLDVRGGVVIKSVSGNLYLAPTSSTGVNNFKMFTDALDDSYWRFLTYGDNYATEDRRRDLYLLYYKDGAGKNLMYFDHGGNIGLGITSPSERLEVVGNVKATAFLYSSDKSLKKDIKKLENYRDILKIDAVRFNWKNDGKADVGIIAQEVQKYFPEFVFKSGDYLAVDYPKLAVPMINLLQEQEKRISDLEKRLEKLENK